MQTVYTKKISIGISACDFGCPVRYNGKGWDMLKLMGREKTCFNWHPVCPECMSGMSVPRNAIKISGGTGADVWAGNAKVKARNGKDVTEHLKLGCKACLETLERAEVKGFVYMDGSPSCGVYRTSLKNKRTGNPPGVFGALLLEKGYFLIPALDLQSPIKWWDWRRRLLAFMWLKEVEINSKKELFEVWHILKFLVGELDDKFARNIGKELATLQNENIKEYSEDLKNKILEILRRPSSLNRIKQSLWKNYSHYKKVTGDEIELIKPPEIGRGMKVIADEILYMERKAYEGGDFFGTSPIIYRGQTPNTTKSLDL